MDYHKLFMVRHKGTPNKRPSRDHKPLTLIKTHTHPGKKYYQARVARASTTVGVCTCVKWQMHLLGKIFSLSISYFGKKLIEFPLKQADRQDSEFKHCVAIGRHISG